MLLVGKELYWGNVIFGWDIRLDILNEEETTKSVAYDTVFAHVRYDHPKHLCLDCQSHLQSDMGQCYSSQISGIGMTIISWLYAPFIFNPHQFLGGPLTGFGVGFSSCSEGVDSPILRTVVPGVELQKQTKAEIGLGQGEHSLYICTQSEVIDMRCCLRLRLFSRLCNASRPSRYIFIAVDCLRFARKHILEDRQNICCYRCWLFAIFRYDIHDIHVVVLNPFHILYPLN